MDEIITKYLQGEADKKEKKQLLAWLNESDEHKKIFSDMRDVWLASGNGPGFGAEYRQRSFRQFVHNVNTYEQNKEKRRVGYTLRRIAAAVIFLLVSIGVGYYAGQYNNVKDETPVAMVAVNHYLMGNDSKGSILLPDSTVVWLHSNSKLSYPEVFEADCRKVSLEGEAYFEVTENKQAPFFVETNNMNIQVLGTSFNVKSYNHQPLIETVLVTGKVDALLPCGESVTLAPNQKIIWDTANGTYDVSTVNAQDYIVWINDKLVFNNETLAEILFKMERWYNLRVSCDARVDLGQRLSLTIRRDTKEEIFKLLGMIAPIQYYIDGEKVSIRPR